MSHRTNNPLEDDVFGSVSGWLSRLRSAGDPSANAKDRERFYEDVNTWLGCVRSEMQGLCQTFESAGDELVARENTAAAVARIATHTRELHSKVQASVPRSSLFRQAPVVAADEPQTSVPSPQSRSSEENRASVAAFRSRLREERREEAARAAEERRRYVESIRKSVRSICGTPDESGVASGTQASTVCDEEAAATDVVQQTVETHQSADLPTYTAATDEVCAEQVNAEPNEQAESAGLEIAAVEADCAESEETAERCPQAAIETTSDPEIEGEAECVIDEAADQSAPLVESHESGSTMSDDEGPSTEVESSPAALASAPVTDPSVRFQRVDQMASTSDDSDGTVEPCAAPAPPRWAVQRETDLSGQVASERRFRTRQADQG